MWTICIKMLAVNQHLWWCEFWGIFGFIYLSQNSEVILCEGRWCHNLRISKRIEQKRYGTSSYFSEVCFVSDLPCACPSLATQCFTMPITTSSSTPRPRLRPCRRPTPWISWLRRCTPHLATLLLTLVCVTGAYPGKWYIYYSYIDFLVRFIPNQLIISPIMSPHTKPSSPHVTFNTSATRKYDGRCTFSIFTTFGSRLIEISHIPYPVWPADVQEFPNSLPLSPVSRFPLCFTFYLQ